MRPTHAREGNLLYSVYHLNVSLIQKHPHKHIESNVWPNAWPPRGPVKLTRWINHHTVWVQKILYSFYYVLCTFFSRAWLSISGPVWVHTDTQSRRQWHSKWGPCTGSTVSLGAGQKDMTILGLLPRPTESESLGGGRGGAQNLCLQKLSKRCSYRPKFDEALTWGTYFAFL